MNHEKQNQFYMENYISLNIKYLREKNKIGQKALSEILGKKTPSSIGHYENGAVTPPLDEIIKMCSFFNVGIEELILSDLASKIDSKSSDINIQVANGNRNIVTAGDKDVEYLRKMLTDKENEIAFLRKLLEKKI